MKTTKYPESLIQVWKWKENVYNDLKNLSSDEKSNYFKKNTDRIIEKLGLKKISKINLS